MANKFTLTAPLEFGKNGPTTTFSTSNPEGVVTAPPGSEHRNTSTGTVWRKTSGTGNTGWAQLGLTGPQGPQGVKGDKGDTGQTGPQGIQGPTGATGPQGPQGIQGPAGSPGLEWRGDWVIGEPYVQGDVVYNNGSSYVCYFPHTGSSVYQPGVSALWQDRWEYVAQKGDTGATGATGATGPTGATGATGPQGPQGVPGEVTLATGDARYVKKAGDTTTGGVNFRIPSGSAGADMHVQDDAWPFQLEGRKDGAGSGRKILYNKTNNRWEFAGTAPALFYGTSDPTEPDQLVPYRMISERGKADTFSRSAGLSIPTANAVFVDGWSKAGGDAGITMSGSHVFFLPTGRWQITYGVVSDSAASSGLYMYMRVGEWFGTMGSPWESRSYLEATTGAGAGQIINTATFIVDSYTKHDTMDMLAQANSGGGRSAYSGTLQFLRIR